MSISAAEQAAPHYLWIDGKERAMIICNPRSLAFALLIAALPVGFALAGGSGGRGGAIGAGVGAGGFGGRRIAEFEQRGRQWSGWNGQPQFECRRWRPGRKWHQYTGNFKRQDNWKQHRWLWRFDWRSARIQRAWWWYLARGLTQPTPTHQWSYGTERCPGCCRGGANLADRTIQARTRRGVDGDSGGAVLWRSGS